MGGSMTVSEGPLAQEMAVYRRHVKDWADRAGEYVLIKGEEIRSAAEHKEVHMTQSFLRRDTAADPSSSDHANVVVRPPVLWVFLVTVGIVLDFFIPLPFLGGRRRWLRRACPCCSRRKAIPTRWNRGPAEHHDRSDR